jgi:transcriptional regulator, XRE family|nr:MAG TPA: helix-turn-helix domain protein [Caudoviricetes sp.]
MTIGRNINHARKLSGMTLEELSKHIGISRQTLSRYENGIIGNIPSDRIEKIAIALNVSPAQLMGWEEMNSSPAEEYYTDPTVNEYAEQLRTNPNMRLLFDATKDMTKEDIDYVVDLVNRLKNK